MATVISSLVITTDKPTRTGTDAEFEQLFNKISSELAIAELDKKLSTAPQPVSDTTSADTTNTDETAATAEKTSSKGFTESDVNYLLGQYATTYEFGSTKKIMELFAAKRSYKNSLKRSFKKVFAYSSDRRIRFSAFKWQFFDNTIIGHGKYKAKITLKKDKGTRHVNADIRVKFQVTDHQLRIARMNFSKVKVRLEKVKSGQRTPVDFSARKTRLTTKSMAPQSQKVSTSAVNNHKIQIPKAKHFKTPTAAELQDIVTRFIGAYESGNINALEDIFSKNAKTNDQNGLSQIKKDYTALFKKTSDRQLFIQSMKWKIVDNYARGKGILNILILADGSNNIDSQQGEIQITARKNNNKVLITHLFHDIRN